MSAAEVPVAVVGAGPVGLTLALRLRQRGVGVVLLEAEPSHQRIGSKAICMQRETLEIWARAGIGERVAERGVQWFTGRTYGGRRELFSFRLPGTTDDHFPPFVNISQSEVEELLVAACAREGVDLRWGWRLVGLTQDAGGVDATFETDAGTRTLRAGWLVGTDGAHSGVRHGLGLEFRGHSFDDRFLICDVRAELPYPAERRFFFDPPWNPGRQVLIHPQPDGIWRIDWQVPSETDVDEERGSGRLDARIAAVIGATTPYELIWATAYRFSQRLVDRFRVGHVFLAGDAAHLMSPFGARGLNSGAADAENLAWKLALVVAGAVSGAAADQLLETYHDERRAAAVDNLAVTEATMRFIAPHGPLRRAWRSVVLRLSAVSGWFRRRVNSGRLAEPYRYAPSTIVASGAEDAALPRHGDVAPDAPLVGEAADPRPVRRLRDLVGPGYVVLCVGAPCPPLGEQRRVAFDVVSVVGPEPAGPGIFGDPTGWLRATYAPNGPRAWLIRPDGHLADSAAPERATDLVARLDGLATRSSSSIVRQCN